MKERGRYIESYNRKETDIKKALKKLLHFGT